MFARLFRSPAATRSAEAIADALLLLEATPPGDLLIYPLSVHAGCGVAPTAEPRVIVGRGRRRQALSPAEARLAARALRDESAFAGSGLTAHWLETAADVADAKAEHHLASAAGGQISGPDPRPAA